MNENTASEILRSKGLAATKQRVAIFLKIEECNCHFTAGELHRMLAEDKFRERVDLATVYRTIKTFERAGLLRCVAEIGNCRYYGRIDNCGFEHPHFYCRKCRRLFCLKTMKLDSRDIDNLEQMGFEPQFLLLTVEGLCAQCSKGGHSKDGQDDRTQRSD